MSDTPTIIEYRSPARLCLTYEVLGKRANSVERFNVVSVMQELALADTLRFTLREDNAINLTVELLDSDPLPHIGGGPGWGGDTQGNIILRAASLLRQVSGAQGGADIHLLKRIPIGWGLAGAASNAATTLRALRQLWSLNLDYSNLLNMADILSQHAPYFIIGGTALVESNEQITPLPPLPRTWALVISPNVQVADKAADLFGLLRWHMMGNGLVSRQLAATLRRGERPSPSLLQSSIEWVVGLRYAEIEDCRRDAVAAGVLDVRYCGPGPCLYALYESEEEALTAQERMKNTPWPMLVSATTNLIKERTSLRINPDDLVLEIGSGDRPNPRSDVLCDRYIDDNTERGGNLQIDRPLVCGDGHYLPFQDKAFDYVIASHIIEHMDDPVKFCQELMRVSRRGYIESPTEIAEKLFFWSFHKWYVNHIGDSIVMQHKDTPNNSFGDLFDYFYAYNPWYERFQKSVPDVFWMTYEWDGEIKICIVDESPLDLESRKSLLRLVRSRETPLAALKSTLVVLGKAIIPRRLVLGVRKLFRKRRTSPRRAVNLERVLACPACQGALKLNPSEATCQNCGRHYPVRNGIPYLLPDEAAAGTLVQSQH